MDSYTIAMALVLLFTGDNKMTYITTHNNKIIGIHKSQSEANAHTQKDEKGDAITLAVFNVELPLNAEVGWYITERGTDISVYPPVTMGILDNDYTQAIRNQAAIIDTLIRNATSPISVSNLVDVLNIIHRKWMLRELQNTMIHDNRQRVKDIAYLITNMFFHRVESMNDLSGNMEVIVEYLPSDRNNLSATKSELDIRIRSIRSVINLARTNTKKWIGLDDLSIQNAIRLADTHAFPEE